MPTPFVPGEWVHTPLGKGEVLEVRNRSILVRIQTRAVLLDTRAVTAAAKPPTHKKPAGAAAALDDGHGHPKDGQRTGVQTSITLDVHGLTVDQALEAIDAALNDALLRNADELRVIHGRSSDRIRNALHRHVRGLSAVRNVRSDPTNAGVSIIVLS